MIHSCKRDTIVSVDPEGLEMLELNYGMGPTSLPIVQKRHFPAPGAHLFQLIMKPEFQKGRAAGEHKIRPRAQSMPSSVKRVKPLKS